MVSFKSYADLSLYNLELIIPENHNTVPTQI